MEDDTMQKREQLPPNIQALAENEPFMALIKKLHSSNMKSDELQKYIRQHVRYYFQLKETTDSAKIDATIKALNFLTSDSQKNLFQLRNIESELIKSFNHNDKDNFKQTMETVAKYVQDKDTKPLLIRPEAKSATPTKLTSTETKAPPSTGWTRSKQPQPPESTPPETIPYPAKHTKIHESILRAIENVSIDGKFNKNAAASFLQSQKSNSAAESQLGYSRAAKTLGIDNVYEKVHTISTKAIKKNDPSKIKELIGFINELKEAINNKKEALSNETSEIRRQRAVPAIAVLTHVEQKLEQVSQECKNAISPPQSVRLSKGPRT
jgi:flagellin-specific chaperone FliS